MNEEINITTGHFENNRIAFIYNPKANTIIFNASNKYYNVLRDISSIYLKMTDCQLKTFKEGIEPRKEFNEYLHTLDRIKRIRHKIQSHKA